MKLRRIQLVYSVFIVILILLSACQTKDDPCDRTVKPEIQVSIKATIHIVDKTNSPIQGQNVTVTYYKIPCGATPKGEFTFKGLTNENGAFYTSSVGYKLRNSNDEVVVDVYAPNLGNGSAEANSEYVHFKYDRLLLASTEEVHVYIYKN